MSSPTHVPVLLDRVVALVAPALERPGSVFVDATLGLGGHTEAVLDRCPEAHVVGVDRDLHALELAGARLAPFEGRTTLVHAVYDEIPEVLAELGIDSVDGILFDLGVSSMQLDVRERGFAYAEDAPLDMRMDDSEGPTAADVLNSYPAAELARILRSYGEEKFARQIARAIVRERETEPFTGSARLVDLLRQTIPAPARRTGGHPAKRTFQALRIEVNDELGVLRRAIPAAIESIGVGGRVVVMSYHSLEDRLVKQAFAAGTTSHGAAGPARRAGRPRAAAALADPRCREGVRRRDRPEPARRLRAAARRRTCQQQPAHQGRHRRMSTLITAAKAGARTRVPRFAEAAVERARLTVVPPRRAIGRTQAARTPFAVLVIAMLVAGVVGLLMFNTNMQQASFKATALQEQVNTLTAKEQSLNMELDALRNPQRLAVAAKKLGMVPPAQPAFIRLDGGGARHPGPGDR